MIINNSSTIVYSKVEEIEPMAIWEVVKELETKRCDIEQDLNMVKATMLVNFGANAKLHPNVIHPWSSAHGMFIAIVEMYETKIKELEKPST